MAVGGVVRITRLRRTWRLDVPKDPVQPVLDAHQEVMEVGRGNRSWKLVQGLLVDQADQQFDGIGVLPRRQLIGYGVRAQKLDEPREDSNCPAVILRDLGTKAGAPARGRRIASRDVARSGGRPARSTEGR
jgi:hypothetical protein